jgi:hypothetical protein
LAHCAACTSLAADLRVVSAAVAWEPLPPRRRDFHIDVERAERLRGSSLRRFLRRLPLPETTALRPAAAGILSIGLLFIVAGAVWPVDDVVPVQPAPAASPAAALQLEAPALAPADESTIVSAPGTDGGLPTLERTAPGLQDNAAAEVEALSATDVQATDRAAVDTTAADRAVEEIGAQAPAAVGMAAEEPTPDDQAAARDDEARHAKAMAAEPAVDAADAELAEPAASAAEAEFAEPAASLAEGSVPLAGVMSPSAPPGEAPLAAVAADGAAAGSTPRPAEATAPVGLEEGLPIESVLMVVGVVLALAGGLLLLLAWLSRRSADPLLR